MQLRGAACRFLQVEGRGDAEVNRLAARQHGHVHRAQLNAAGLSRAAIDHRLKIGMLHRALPGVYLVGRPTGDPRGRHMAAVLHFRGDAVLGSLTAAQHWDLPVTVDRAAPIDVVLLARNANRVDGIRIKRVKALAPADVRWRHDLPLTSPARTLLDLAVVVDELELEAAMAVALRSGLVRRAQVLDVVARNPHATAVGRLRRLATSPTPLRDTRSGYERRLLRLLSAAELPAPLTNVHVEGKLVDMYWPDLRLVVEFDSWSFHGDRASFEQDRLTDQRLGAAGNQVTRITARQVDGSPYALVARLATLIAVARARASSLAA